MRSKRLCSLILAGGMAVTGCENAQQKARYVKEPLETVDASSLASVNIAVREARTRLLTVRNRELRAELSKDLDGEYERMTAQIRESERREKERAEAEAETRRQQLELEERREALRLQKVRESEQAETRLAEETRAADTDPARHGEEQPLRQRNRKAVKDLQVDTRPSLLGDGTQVLVLRNSGHDSADFDLTCYTLDDAAKKTFMVNIPPRSEKHIGFVQGWLGNFKSGERCEASADGELLWNHAIP